MLKKLIQTYTRTSLEQEFYPSKEQFTEEWNYIQTKYGDSLPTVTETSSDLLVFKIEKVGEESVINEFIEEITSETGRLHNRIVWCQNNNVTYAYEITEA